MHTVLSNHCVSVTELKRNYTQILLQANNQAIAVLNHNRPEAYLLPAALYEQVLEKNKQADKQAAAKDARGYPLGFFEAVAANAPHWADFPLAEELRTNDVPDAPRESW